MGGKLEFYDHCDEVLAEYETDLNSKGKFNHLSNITTNFFKIHTAVNYLNCLKHMAGFLFVFFVNPVTFCVPVHCLMKRLLLHMFFFITISPIRIYVKYVF